MPSNLAPIKRSAAPTATRTERIDKRDEVAAVDDAVGTTAGATADVGLRIDSSERVNKSDKVIAVNNPVLAATCNTSHICRARRPRRRDAGGLMPVYRTLKIRGH